MRITVLGSGGWGTALALLLLAFNLIGTALHKTLNVKQAAME